MVPDSLVEYQQIVARVYPTLTMLHADYLRDFQINAAR